MNMAYQKGLFGPDELPALPRKSTQNRSSAVMQQRIEDPDSLEDFPTPSWGTRALCEYLTVNFGDLGNYLVREPAANRGFMARPLAEYFGGLLASDIHDYGQGYPIFDFLKGVGPLQQVDWTITNPPFNLATDFIQRARETSRIGAAFLLRIAFLEGITRYGAIFKEHRPALVLQFSERLPMLRSRIDPTGGTATAYAWFIWRFDQPAERTELDWIEPCRSRLELPDDYPGFVLDERGKWRIEADKKSDG